MLTDDNHERLLAAAQHNSKREVEVLVASERPQPAVPTLMRKRPVPKFPTVVDVPLPIAPADDEQLRSRNDEGLALKAQLSSSEMGFNPPSRPVLKPLSPECYKVQFTISLETHEKLRRAQDLLRHTIPTGDLAVVFERG